MIKWTFLVFMLLSGNVISTPYVIHHSSKTTGGTMHHLSHFDPEKKAISLTADIGLSDTGISYLTNLGQEKDWVVYLPAVSGLHLPQLVVYNPETLIEKLRIDVPELLDSSQHVLKTSSLFMSGNGKHIVLLSGQNQLSVHLFELKTGKTLLSRPLNPRQSEVAITTDKKFLYAKNIEGNGRTLTVIDINAATTSAVVNMGSSDVRTVIHGSKMLVSMEKKTNRRPVFELYQISLETGEKSQVDIPLSEYHFVFAGNSDNTSYIAGKQSKGKRDLFIVKITDEAVSQPAFQRRKIMPRSMELSKNQKVLMVLGEDKMAAINTHDLSLKSRNRLPFDVLTGIISEDGSLGVIQENIGSEIGFVDLVEGDVIKQMGAGRMSVKVAKTTLKIQVVATGALLSVVSSVVEYFESAKQLQFSADESRLMVINENSNDITFFDAVKFKKLDAISTGNRTELMLQFKQADNKVLTVNRNQINVFNARDGEEILEIKPANLVGVGLSEGLVFYQKGVDLHQINLSELTQPKKYQTINALGVYELN